MIKDILTRLGYLFKSEEQPAVLETPAQTQVRFVLSHSTTTIGELTLDNGYWTFRYTEAFKQQTRLVPIVDFPDIYKDYTSTELFPYFTYRIPSLARPQVQQIIRKQKIDSSNTVALLKHFGQRTIVNPFVLELG